MSESDGGIEIRWTTNPSTLTLERPVNFTVSTSAGTATANVDFSLSTNFVSLNQVNLNLQVAIREDRVIENEESFSVNLDTNDQSFIIRQDSEQVQVRC